MIKDTFFNRKQSVYDVAEGVKSLRIVFVNVLMVKCNDAKDDKRWVLVDAGLKGFSGDIIREAEKNFGEGTKPECIILTHGHFDHVGALKELLEKWDVPVYASKMEMPYLTGESAYPPPDTTVGGGAMSLMAWMYPKGARDFRPHIQTISANGEVPNLPDWKWLSTPGHSPGHISLYRERDRTLIAGDAVVNTKQESIFAVAMQKRELNPPPAYFTCDWMQARISVELLESLKPEVIASGHGAPMRGTDMKRMLHQLATQFDRKARPKHGRYADQPAITDEHGIVKLPSPVAPVSTKVAMAIGVAAVVAALSYWASTRKNGSEKHD